MLTNPFQYYSVEIYLHGKMKELIKNFQILILLYFVKPEVEWCITSTFQF